jgi:hypothetical protein
MLSWLDLSGETFWAGETMAVLSLRGFSARCGGWRYLSMRFLTRAARVGYRRAHSATTLRRTTCVALLHVCTVAPTSIWAIQFGARCSVDMVSQT